jgi:hypothetical protein
MIFSIHQPNYIPYLGYFYKISKSDIFVILDTVQYPRGQSFSPRNRIKTPQGAHYLTIPVKVPGGRDGKALYTEILFANENWYVNHLKTVEQSYKKAPFFGEIYEIYGSVIKKPFGNISELNIELIKEFCRYLEITTKIVTLSSLLEEFGQKTDLIIDIAKKLEADKYLSGTGGGKEYNNEEKMNAAGIELVYSKFKPVEYKQLWGDFIANLSVIDVLFNCGPGIIDMLNH